MCQHWPICPPKRGVEPIDVGDDPALSILKLKHRCCMPFGFFYASALHMFGTGGGALS